MLLVRESSIRKIVEIEMGYYMDELKRDGNALENLFSVFERNRVSPKWLETFASDGALDDLFDPCAEYSRERIRRAMRIDDIMTQKSWTITVDRDRTLEARLARMEESSNASLFGTAEKKLVWLIVPVSPEDWTFKGMKEGHVAERVICRTLRFQGRVTPTRVLNEMDRLNVDFAGLDHMVAWLTANVFKLRTSKEVWDFRHQNRGLFITERRFLDGTQFHLEHYGLHWHGHKTVGLGGTIGGNPFAKSDLLVVDR